MPCIRTLQQEALPRLESLRDAPQRGRVALARTLIEHRWADAVVIADVGLGPAGVVPTSLVVDGRDRAPLTPLVRALALGPLPDFRRPGTAECNGFAPVADPLTDRCLGPELRLLVGEGDVIHTYIGLFGSTERSTPSRAVRGLLAEHEALLVDILRATRSEPVSNEGALVLDAEGRVFGGEVGLTDWLAEGRAPTLCTLVRLCRDGDRVEGPIDGSRLQARFASGSTGSMWIGSIAPAKPVRIAADARLTPTQRKVAWHLARGLSAKEVASELGIGTETARGHLRDIYARLQVSTRVELAQRLGAVAPAEAERRPHP